MRSCITDKFFYHIYPLGMCNAPKRNDFSSPKSDCINRLQWELDRLKSLGVNALYIGPLFESTSHGYDTVDYYFVDRRLGNNEDFKNFVRACHEHDISVVVDAVFNHTGRDFFAFKDIQQKGSSSRYKDWYKNIRFDGHSPYGDNFTYEGWAGCMDLVKLNVDNEEVRSHIFGAVEKWIREFDIDGLRLDAADVLTPSFMEALRIFTSNIKNDFWLMGEVVHGDYNNWVSEKRLDSVTNYQLYKGMWSSFNSANMFEVAWTLNQQFGSSGTLRNKILYNFLDNHDVNRLASTVSKQTYLFTLYGMLFTIPGIPSIYYGSEYGIKGKRNDKGDYELRPALKPFACDFEDFSRPEINPQDLIDSIKKFAYIRSQSNALKKGDYTQIALTNTSFAFKRTFYGEEIIVVFNQAEKESLVKLPSIDGTWTDLLSGLSFSTQTLENISVPACYLRILKKN